MILFGVYERDGLVRYIANGLPIYAQLKEDLRSFRYITSNFVHQGLCRKVDIQGCFSVSEVSVQRGYKKFVQQGERGFFSEDARKGTAYKSQGSAEDAYKVSWI